LSSEHPAGPPTRAQDRAIERLANMHDAVSVLMMPTGVARVRALDGVVVCRHHDAFVWDCPDCRVDHITTFRVATDGATTGA
jgi:hypothetical protein